MGPGMIDRRRLMQLGTASALAPAFASHAAHAQGWPSRVVRFVVPYSAGGPTDIVARLIADRLTNIWGRQVVIENRGGAGSNLGAEAVARSSADGYTALIGASAIALNPSLYRSVGYDPVADFSPVTQICSFPFFMFVPNASPARSVGDFIALAKQNRGKLTYGSAGVGSAQHLCVEMFQRSAGIELIHVPYRGASDGLNDLIPGRIDLYFSSGALLEQMRAGQIRGLAVSGGKRDLAAPELPTVAEAGVAGFDVTGWFAIFVPARTPPEIVRRMQADTVAVLAEPAIRAKLEQLGYTVVGSTPDELARHLQAEIAKWGAIIKAAGISISE
jgi:tripartite-type tricarboxylate transporter receptor subunit TctC